MVSGCACRIGQSQSNSCSLGKVASLNLVAHHTHNSLLAMLAGV